MGQNQSSAPSQAEVSSALAVMEAVTQEDCPRWTKKKLKELMRAMKALGARSGKPTLIYRCDLEAALKKTGLQDTVEGEILGNERGGGRKRAGQRHSDEVGRQ
ncbi:hypothetical protein Naga_101706g2 [Nannochloropsis gaditana]|uniref:Uncharacterized protein n=1 Tax=Nannochloropsis gaditana TaxID=72520 RepID=W7T660_9STRA|nr:hypothetical protein Naga_101706g2 [Nannochloropsis gaditana]